MSEEEQNKESGQISRRQFLAGAGLVVGGAAIGTGITYPLVSGKETEVEVKVPTYVCIECGLEFATVQELTVHHEAEHPEVPGPTIEELTKLTVNGEDYEFKVEPHWSLLNVLRDMCGLTGTKNGCTGRGECGVCTVLVDGVPTLSCITLANECDGKSILTVEGLEENGKLHPLQEAFIQNFAFQCGFCTPGMLLTAKALLAEKPAPTEDEVREALGGNLCRCGPYSRIIKSVLDTAVILKG